jgi:transposase
VAWFVETAIRYSLSRWAALTRYLRDGRLEMSNNGKRRRRWRPEQKREIVAERYGGDLTPTEVTRKHGISSGQLYTWRRDVLGLRTAVLTRAAPQFAAVEIADATSPATPPVAPTGAAEMQAPPCPGGRIEIVLPGEIVVRVDAQVGGGALRRVLDALRRR